MSAWAAIAAALSGIAALVVTWLGARKFERVQSVRDRAEKRARAREMLDQKLAELEKDRAARGSRIATETEKRLATGATPDALEELHERTGEPWPPRE